MNQSAPKLITTLAPQEQVASPCINVCRIDAKSGYCEGCLRTLEEISAWRDSSNEERREVLARVAEREKKTAG